MNIEEEVDRNRQGKGKKEQTDMKKKTEEKRVRVQTGKQAAEILKEQRASEYQTGGVTDLTGSGCG